jgi:hypothetical protein
MMSLEFVIPGSSVPVRILQVVGYFEQARRLRLMGAAFDDTGTDCL